MARRRRNNRRRRRGSFAPFYKLLCLVVIVAAIVVALSLFFKVEHIAVDGNSRYTNVEVVSASGVKQGDNLFLMNKYNVAGRISGALPYVEAVSINRDLPDTLQIHIQECVCSIALEQEGTTWIMCSSGKVVDEISGSAPEKSFSTPLPGLGSLPARIRRYKNDTALPPLTPSRAAAAAICSPAPRYRAKRQAVSPKNSLTTA